ncbi:MAG: XRE family transcriptional regulator [Myxococcales bacterium]|nr:MAG: XRE family transcriptional regulator [Myxococcales bacterium]
MYDVETKVSSAGRCLLTEPPRAATVGRVSDWQERLSEAMDTRGWSGGDLGRRTGFSAQYINSLRKKGRGARLPLETAQKLAQALGVALDWLVRGEGPREATRLSDVYPVFASPEALPDPFPSRTEVIALLGSSVEPEVIAALRAAQLPSTRDPGRDFWVGYARDLVRALRSIRADPVFQGVDAPRVRTGR